jgi:DNA-binding transcriptional ArsR family regulator
MIEYTLPLDAIFNSLADPTRRDILTRLQRGMINVTDIAEPYDISLAAVSKHLKVLEQAQLIIKCKQGRERYAQLAPQAMAQASEYISAFI